LRKAVFAGTVKTVVVWKLDRLFRRQRDDVNLLADWCECGVLGVSRRTALRYLATTTVQ
jgi:hypothetical protein